MSRYRGKRYRGWRKGLVALVLAGILCFGLLFGAVLYGAYDHISGEPEIMVVLGCQVHDWGPSILLQDRLDTALEYLNEHPDMTVVVSGGQGSNEPSTEAQAMADYLEDHGISRENILLEEASHNTKENLQYTKQLLEQNGYHVEDGVVLVSNGFHLTRSRMLAERFGYGDISTLAAPSSHIPAKLKMYVREPLALVKSFVFDR